MTNKAIFVPSATLSNNDSLLIALFVAVIVHIVLVLGMNFTTPQPEKINKSIDITLINTPAKKEPEKSNFIAQENQLGAGEKTKKPEPPVHKRPIRENSQKKPIKKIAPEESKPKVAQKIITQQKAEKKVVTASKAAVVRQTEKHPQLTAEALHQQIAQLGTEIRQSQPSADQTKIKFVNSVSAHKYVAAQYMKDWESKVERTGNRNYPEAAAKKNFSGTLTMDVGINADGSIYSIRISRSSGNPELDEAAKKIVRMSAPFAPLPLELRKELDVLVITRVWKFSDESGLVTR
ncbi:MAG: TonB family protein [Methylococcaceae bacterium]|jgi:protein TonB